MLFIFFMHHVHFEMLYLFCSVISYCRYSYSFIKCGRCFCMLKCTVKSFFFIGWKSQSLVILWTTVSCFLVFHMKNRSSWRVSADLLRWRPDPRQKQEEEPLLYLPEKSGPHRWDMASRDAAFFMLPLETHSWGSYQSCSRELVISLLHRSQMSQMDSSTAYRHNIASKTPFVPLK